ncbi:PREDICTED: tryptophan synthase beta chain 1-like isoform X1 [Lupinus angustifolius]|uniref:tryptophan synthase beta chain 1-like isoform X1 n=1 Tax=Lupinus angustifolius TaxID=3871 RepID=UPI00092F7E2D|nr:PREDICTED: tryptophan synthase beta chain 1-like isoform X1 [Lupinus angustifolius]
MACILQGAYVSSHRQFNDKDGSTPRPCSSVVVRSVVTTLETMKTITPCVPPLRSLKERKELISEGKFGRFGGKFVPETLVTCLSQLEAEFKKALHDELFQLFMQEELATALREFVGRETPLYNAERLSEYYKSKNSGEGPEIYLKREDLNHCGSHKMNNALAQAMIANRIGKRDVITATGAGQHGLATSAACAKLGLECTVFMAAKDMDRQYSNVQFMKLLGAQVEAVNGSFKDAASDAFRCWVENLEKSYLLTGSAVGPHPCPTMVREFQSVIGKETKKQALKKWGGKPDVLIACVGTGSNALGLFHEFIKDEDVRLIGVEAGGLGLKSGKHSSTLTNGEVGVYHGAMSYLLQDEYGQIIEPHSIAAGMEYPGVSPELSFLKESGRAQFCSATDQEALNAYERLCKLEGIIPSLEAAHALAILDKVVPTLCNGHKVVVNCCGRGDKDAPIVLDRTI